MLHHGLWLVAASTHPCSVAAGVYFARSIGHANRRGPSLGAPCSVVAPLSAHNSQPLQSSGTEAGIPRCLLGSRAVGEVGSSHDQTEGFQWRSRRIQCHLDEFSTSSFYQAPSDGRRPNRLDPIDRSFSRPRQTVGPKQRIKVGSPADTPWPPRRRLLPLWPGPNGESMSGVRRTYCVRGQ